MRTVPFVVMSFVLRLVPGIPVTVSADGIVGELEAVSTGERFVVHNGDELIDVLRRVMATSSGAQR